ncbi:MAG: hypothetical protein ABI639_11450 [Thermoanaerobaculia bacterium]
MTMAEVRRFAMSLPEVEGKPHFDLWSFRIGGKIFATVPADEEHLHLFLGEEERAPWLGSLRSPGSLESVESPGSPGSPGSFGSVESPVAEPGTFQPLTWGGKVVGLRVALAGAPRAAVEELLYAAWLLRAPRRLVSAAVKRP